MTRNEMKARYEELNDLIEDALAEENPGEAEELYAEQEEIAAKLGL